MAIYKTSNPALNDKTFAEAIAGDVSNEGVMTIDGTVNKIGILLFITMVSAAWVWNSFTGLDNVQNILPYLIPGAILAFIVALITIFNKKSAYITAPIYCIFEGMVLGGLSVLMNAIYPGIAFGAMVLTFGILFSLLIFYKFKIIKATQNVKMMAFAGLTGIVIYYIVDLVAGLFGMQMPLINDSGPWGILFSVFVIIIACLNLVVDFDFIEQGAQNNAPKYMEWYAAFGLMVTLIWLYLEILRLLSKIKRR